MRRCKYCTKEYGLKFYDDFCDIYNNYCYPFSCPNYTQVKLDPFWKDIFDETNRRLNNDK